METEESSGTLQIITSFVIYTKKVCTVLKSLDYVAMKFSRQEYWGGLPFPSLGDLPDPGIEPRYPALWADSSPAEPPGKRTNLATGVGSLFLLQGIFPTRDRTQAFRFCFK